MTKYTFIAEEGDDSNSKLSMEFETDSIEVLISQLHNFLLGATFSPEVLEKVGINADY